MKMINKGKVYPSSSSSSPFPVTSPAGDSLSVLNLLPAAILSLAVVLSLEDREVLAYMITRSIKSTNLSSASSKKTSNTHKPPLFDCDCFDCYTSYWFKWDSSPNRELIHQAIEAFEESLTTNEQSKKKGKKTGHRRLAGKKCCPSPEGQGVQVLPEYDVALVEVKAEENGENPGGVLKVEVEEEPPETAVILGDVTPAAVLRSRDITPAACQHKGLARKVLPDVIGLLNWRLWSLWNPNA